jgi:Na+/melibiose symporter-like transporter
MAGPELRDGEDSPGMAGETNKDMKKLGNHSNRHEIGCFGFICSVVCLFVCLLFCFCFFRNTVPLYSSGCPGTHFADQTDLELRNPPASASQVLGLKACATTAWLRLFFNSENRIKQCSCLNPFVGNRSFVLFCFVLFCSVLFYKWLSSPLVTADDNTQPPVPL